ncbi:HNH endonuclease [Sandaracinus amylolyticus]|uniref:HNH endonuclease n=1 Tax=Sandaracinus amylolyticus TaxID=927083 RepID=UPI001F3EC7A4|nr:HNH endonuclease [Sandaracinus amylolyticus]UJR81468.1 HNH endonuclease [Sandaracinus amylolyticus]
MTRKRPHWKRENRARHWLRKRVIDAAGGRCLGCGEMVNLIENHPLQATLDHVVPLARGGRHVLANVQLLCRACNQRKGCTPPEFWTRYDEEHAA